MAKRRTGIRDIYRSIRKPGAPPTRVERDERGKIRGREDAREIEVHKGSRNRPERED